MVQAAYVIEGRQQHPLNPVCVCVSLGRSCEAWRNDECYAVVPKLSGHILPPSACMCLSDDGL